MPDTIKENELGLWDKVTTWGYSVIEKAKNLFAEDKKTISSSNTETNVTDKNDLMVLNADMITPEVRSKMIDELATNETLKYIDLQKKYLHESITQIKDYSDRWQPVRDRECVGLEQRLSDIKEKTGFNEAIRKLELENLEVDEYLKQYDDLEVKYGIADAIDENDEILAQRMKEKGFPESPIRLANRITGLGNGDNSYCISIQTSAMGKAAKEMDCKVLNGVKDGMGWTCKYADNFFNEAGFVDKFDENNMPFEKNEKGNWIVKKDKDGNPLIEDGDMGIVGGGHCVRLNVDKDGEISYSAGNAESINETKVGWMTSLSVIHTSDYAKKLLAKEYQFMNNEELFELYKKSMKENSDDGLSAQNTSKEVLKSKLKIDSISALSSNLNVGISRENNENISERCGTVQANILNERLQNIRGR